MSACLLQYGGSRWYLQTRIKGVLKRRSLKTKDQAEAERILAEERQRQRANSFACVNVRWKPQDLEGIPGGCLVTRQCHACASRAAGILSGDQALAWLFQPKPRVTTLSHLGRVPDIGIMRMAALEICERQLPLAKAAQFLRNMRGRRNSPRPTSLAKYLHRAINRYLRKTPLHPLAVIQHLNLVLMDYESSLPQEGPAGGNV